MARMEAYERAYEPLGSGEEAGGLHGASVIRATDLASGSGSLQVSNIQARRPSSPRRRAHACSAP